MANWWSNLRQSGPAPRAGALVLAMAVVGLAVAPGAWALGGSPGLRAAAAAGAFCLAGGLVAFLAAHLLRAPKRILWGALVSAAARTGIPLALTLLCYALGTVSAEAGLVYYVAVFYPVMLAVETALSLPHPQGAAAGCAEPGRN